MSHKIHETHVEATSAWMQSDAVMHGLKVRFLLEFFWSRKFPLFGLPFRGIYSTVNDDDNSVFKNRS